MNIYEPECVQLRGQAPSPGLTRARDFGRVCEGTPNFAECTWHFIEYAESVALLEHENAARYQCSDQPLHNDVPVSDVQQDESGMDEIKCALGDVAGDEVELGNFATEAR